MENLKLFKLNFIVISTFWIIGCREINNNNSLEKDTLVSNELSKGENKVSPIEETFKKWLVDTIPDLNSWRGMQELNIVKKDYFIRKDSLALTILKYFSINSSSFTDQDSTLNVVNLLRQYDEFPKTDFILTYVDKMFYYNSGTVNRIYDYTNSISDVQVLVNGKKIEYLILRGRLISKTYYDQNIDGTESQTKVNFVWNGDKMEKVIEGTQK